MAKSKYPQSTVFITIVLPSGETFYKVKNVHQSMRAVLCRVSKQVGPTESIEVASLAYWLVANTPVGTFPESF